MKFIVDFKDHVTRETIETYINNIGGSVVKTFSVSNKTFLIDSVTEPVFDSEIHEHIINDDDSVLKLLGTTTIISNQKWGTKDLTGPTVSISTSDKKDWWKNYIVLHPELDAPTYSIDKRGQGYTVYVLDSGCELTHPEFNSRPISNLFSFNSDYTDTNGHGTAIASVITGATCGITDATVKVVKIFDKNQPTKQSDLVNALDAIHNDFIQNQMSFAILNCSWSISKNTFIESKLQSLINMGIVVVAAAGNNGMPIADVTPASMDSAITIGSFNSNLEPSDFSNYTGSSISLTTSPTNHGQLDGWAPGEEIYTAGLNGQYGFASGTSIAAGIHSAVSAYNLTVLSLDYAGTTSKSDYLIKNSLMRSTILNFSDPKYHESSTAITSLVDYVDVRDKTHLFGSFSKAVSKTMHYVKVFDPRNVSKLEILEDLPFGFTVSDIGVFSGIAPEVSVPVLISIPMILYDIDQEKYEFDFKIIHIPDNYDMENDSTGDPILDLQLSGYNSNRNCGLGSPVCVNYPFECIDNCGLAGPCAEFTDKGQGCFNTGTPDRWCECSTF